MIKLEFSRYIITLYLFLITPFVFATSYQDWLNGLKNEALEYGISKQTFIDTVSYLKKPNKKVLKYYNNQPEFKISFNDYYKRNISTERVNKGKKLLLKHNLLLDNIYKEFLAISNEKAWVYEILQKEVLKSYQFMRHGHEMLWFSRWSFSESELPLSYNAKFTNTRARGCN